MVLKIQILIARNLKIPVILPDMLKFVISEIWFLILIFLLLILQQLE